jgi:hypothetical protein
MGHSFVTSQGSPYIRFRRALDRGNVTEALSAASELDYVSLAEALELTLLLVDGDPEKYSRAALRWHVRFVEETKNVDIRESQAVLAIFQLSYSGLTLASVSCQRGIRRAPPVSIRSPGSRMSSNGSRPNS